MQRGRPALSSHGVTLRWAGHYGQARNMVSSFQFWVLPIPASRPMPSGHFMCMAPPPTEETANLRLGCCRKRPEVGCGWHWWGRLVAQKVSRWACPGIVGLPWRGGCPQVGPRRAQAPEMGPDMGRAKRYAQCGLGDMSALKRNMFRHVC